MSKEKPTIGKNAKKYRQTWHFSRDSLEKG